MQTNSTSRAAYRAARSRQLPWLSSPSFRGATTWLIFLMVLRCCGTWFWQALQGDMDVWLGTPIEVADLTANIQHKFYRLVMLVGGPLLALATSVMAVQCIWQLRWSAAVSDQAPSSAISPWGRSILTAVQWIGCCLAFAGSAWWGAYHLAPLTILPADATIGTTLFVTGTVAWRLGFVWGMALLLVACVDVFLRAQFLQPDDEQKANADREARKEANGGLVHRRRTRGKSRFVDVAGPAG